MVILRVDRRAYQHVQSLVSLRVHVVVLIRAVAIEGFAKINVGFAKIDEVLYPNGSNFYYLQ